MKHISKMRTSATKIAALAAKKTLSIVNCQLLILVFLLMPSVAKAEWDGSGTSGDPYQIKTVDDLIELADNVYYGDSYADTFFKLVNPLNLNDVSWFPIGDFDMPFSGNFNGNNLKISNLYIYDVALEDVGLFGYVKNGNIENLVVENGDITGLYYVGGVVGSLDGGSVKQCCFSGYVDGESNVGGIAGWTESGEISNCYSIGEITSDEVIGGIVGCVDYSKVKNCYSIGKITGKTHAGGIVGYVDYSEISSCAALNPTIAGTSFLGRVAGFLDTTYGPNTLSNNVAFEEMTGATWSNIGLDKQDGDDISKATINTDGTLGNRFTAPVWTIEAGKLPGLFGATVEMPEYLQLTLEPPVITTTTLPDGKVDEPYTATLEATGDDPIEWAVVGTLPYGLTLATATGEITGTPVIKGDFTFTVKATNAAGSAEQEFTINISEDVGIEQLTMDNGQLKIYPNPTNGQLTMDNGQLTMENIEIYDIMGRRIATTVRAYPCGRPNETTINVEFLPSGVYFIKIGEKTAKFVKN